MQGAATLEATARGPLDAIQAQATLNARDLVVQGRRLGATEVKATAAGLPATPNGTVSARTNLDKTPLSLDGRYALREQTLRLDGLTIANGNNRITGEAQVALDTLLATGRLEGKLPNLNGLSELAGSAGSRSGWQSSSARSRAAASSPPLRSAGEPTRATSASPPRINWARRAGSSPNRAAMLRAATLRATTQPPAASTAWPGS